jgi:hypothetical protein
LIEEWSAQALAAYDAETRFRALALSADVPDALRILDRLDAGGSAASSVIESPKR